LEFSNSGAIHLQSGHESNYPDNDQKAEKVVDYFGHSMFRRSGGLKAAAFFDQAGPAWPSTRIAVAQSNESG